MMKSAFAIYKRFAVFIYLNVCGILSFGQAFSPYYTNSFYQKYINYLQNSNKLKISHPLSQPYTANEIYDSLPEEVLYTENWLSAFKKHMIKYVVKQNEDKNFKGKLNAGAEGGNSNNFVLKKNINDFYAKGFVNYSYKNIVFSTSIVANEAYLRDTLYFGTTGKLENKNFARFDDSYVKWENKNYSLFAGRINRNFGLPESNSLILSSNSFSFDHLAFTFKNKQLKYTTLFSRLNDIYGYDIRDSISIYQWNTRFLNIHRFEILLTKKIEIAFTDVILFGGKDATPQFHYLNPVNFLFFTKMSDRKSYKEGNANALMCIDLYFKPTANLTFFGQFLIDDIDFTKSLRAVYPDRLGYSAKIIYTNLFPASQIQFSYNRISNWTYNSFYTWGNYTFYGKSIGYPENGVENFNLELNVFKFYPFILSMNTNFERHRKTDFNLPFIAEKTDFPYGIAETGKSLKISINYIPVPYFSLNVSTEYIAYSNYNYVDSLKKSFINIYLDMKLSGIFSLL